MKILFLGDLRSRARSCQRFEQFKKLKFNVHGITTVTEKKHRVMDFFSRVTNKLGYPLDLDGFNKEVLNVIEKKNFDLIWLEKPLKLKSATLKKVRKKNPKSKIVFTSEDDMFQKHNQSKHFLSYISECDLVFTTKSYNLSLNELPALGAKKVCFLNKSYDPDFHRPISLSEKDLSEFGVDVGFIGSFEKDRANKLMFLAENGIKVRVYGNGWRAFFDKHKNLEIMDQPIYGDSYIKAICATKINLSFLRKANRDLQTDRTMEIPACGAFMLTERTSEHLELFREGVEAAYFDTNNESELLEKVQYYLKNDKERLMVAQKGRKRCVSSQYDHKAALNHMLKVVQED